MKQQEAQNYWASVAAIRNAVKKRELNQSFITPDFQDTRDEPRRPFQAEKLFERGTPSVKVLEELSDGTWPEDFLLKFGTTSAGGCGSSQFGFHAEPRKLYMLIAVVLAVGRHVPITGIEYLVDARNGLRREAREQASRVEEFPEQVITTGQSLVIPLRLELRYNFDEGPVSTILDGAGARRIHQRIIGINKNVFQARDNGRRWMEKSKSSFKPPEGFDITRSYVSGPSRNITGVQVGGRMFPAKSAPRIAVVSVGEFDGGSCPFLLIKEDDGEWSYHGRVLVAADESSKSRK
ncbi:hypothetical protein ACQVP2_35230 [Methylobacterium aquaticum]|uniref:hypothetical protein n=1 Tax=Methylobacterium aquaticum TaxID=270351 RepID=UPI003D17E289